MGDITSDDIRLTEQERSHRRMIRTYLVALSRVVCGRAGVHDPCTDDHAARVVSRMGRRGVHVLGNGDEQMQWNGRIPERFTFSFAGSSLSCVDTKCAVPACRVHSVSYERWLCPSWAAARPDRQKRLSCPRGHSDTVEGGDDGAQGDGVAGDARDCNQCAQISRRYR